MVKLYYNFDPSFAARFFQRWTYDRLMGIVSLLVGLGVLFALYLIVKWIAAGFALTSLNFISIYGLELIMLGAQVFSFTLTIEALKRFRYHSI